MTSEILIKSLRTILLLQPQRWSLVIVRALSLCSVTMMMMRAVSAW